MSEPFTESNPGHLSPPYQRNPLASSGLEADIIRELCNMVMCLSDQCRDEALKARAEKLVRRVWEASSSP